MRADENGRREEPVLNFPKPQPRKPVWLLRSVVLIELLLTPVASAAAQTAVQCELPTDDLQLNGRRADACRRQLEQQPSSAAARLALASNLLALGDLPAAESEFARLAADNHGMFDAHFNLGLVREFLGRFSKSRDAFQAALETARNTADKQTAAWHLGVSHSNLNEDEEALGWFRSAIVLDPSDTSAWGAAAVTASRLGNPILAVSLWTRAIRIDPHYLDRVSEAERQLYRQRLREVGAQKPAEVDKLDPRWETRRIP